MASPMPFTDFFPKVTGHQPFLWQQEMADMLVANQWHDILGIPPATGKTSLLEIWYYALYRNILDKPNQRYIPMRLWYVVDRKVIVDGAFNNAVRLQGKLDGPLRSVGQIVQEYFGCSRPLVVGKIRGGMDRDQKNKWLNGSGPNQPTIVTATVDQYGSRLLFRGYGVSPRTRSIHAAMTGVDCLVALDEAHLTQSLRGILGKVNGNFRLPGIPATKAIELTATSGHQNDPFPINIAQDEVLAKRLNAQKNITLKRIDGKTNLIDSLAKEARSLAGKHKIVGVVCNTVMTARKVFNKLKPADNPVLLIGRIRGHEREQIGNEHFDKLLAGRDRSKDKPIIVVATQTIEVGADFDFDAMASQAAPLDCLIQRFGRMNRIGVNDISQGVVFFKKETDRVYGSVTQETFDWLEANNPDGFDINKVKYDPAYFAKTNHIAELRDCLLETLSYTHPVRPFSLDGLLHGVKTKSDSDFQIMYRRELTEEMLLEGVDGNWLKLNPPQNQEILSLPIYSISQGDSADNEGINNEKTDKPNPLLNRRCVRYRDGEVIRMKEIVPGDLVVVPVTHGQYDKFGWNPDNDAPVGDVSDHYNKKIIRLHPRWCPGFKLDNYKPAELDGKIDIPALVDDLNDNLIPSWEADPQLKEWGNLVKERLAGFDGGYIRMTPDEQGLYLFLPSKNKNDNQERQRLKAHNAKVGENARAFAKSVGLPAALVDILERSGKYHDLGKADPRFQDRLYYPNVANPKIPLAKSKGNNFKAPKRTPKGWRHELQSVVAVLDNNLAQGTADPDLLVHLIASHHGWFRNFIPLTPDPLFREFRLEENKFTRSYFEMYPEMDRNAFYRLNDKYGYWGLAYLETILRLADWKN